VKKQILIVDDYLESCELLCEVLSEEYQCAYTQDSTLAVEKVSELNPDLVILDFKMPGLLGVDICQKIRETESMKYLPIVFVSGAATIEDKILAFERGADDFVSKPFHIKELHLRIKRLFQRDDVAETDLSVGNLSMNLIRRKVTVANEDIQLTPKQFDILKLMIQNKTRPVLRETFLTQVWGDTEVTARNVDSQINYLKKKIEKFTGRIISVPGSGYKIDLD